MTQSAQGGNDSSKEKRSGLKNLKAFHDELKTIIKEWSLSVAVMLRIEGNEKCVTIKQAIEAIADLYDKIEAAESTNEQLQEKVDRMKDRKQQLHDDLSFKIEQHKKLFLLPPRIRREYEAIGRKRSAAAVELPEAKADLPAYLGKLYDWGCRLLAEGEKRIPNLNGRAKGKAEDDDKSRRLENDAINSNMEKTEEELKTVTAENKKLRSYVEEVKRNMQTANVSNRTVFEQLVRVTTQSSATQQKADKRKNVLATAVDHENRKIDNNRDAVDRLSQMLDRRKNEAKKLDQDIELHKLFYKDRTDSDSSKSDALKRLQQRQKMLRSEIRQKSIITRKLSLNLKERRIDTGERVERDEEEKRMEKLRRECQESRRFVNVLKAEIDSILNEIEKEKRAAVDSEYRLKRAVAKLNGLKDKLNAAQMLSRPRHCRPAADADQSVCPIAFDNVMETSLAPVGRLPAYSTPLPDFAVDNSNNFQRNMFADLWSEIGRMNEDIDRLEAKCKRNECRRKEGRRNPSRLDRTRWQKEIEKPADTLPSGSAGNGTPIALDFYIDEATGKIASSNRSVKIDENRATVSQTDHKSPATLAQRAEEEEEANEISLPTIEADDD